MNYVIVALTAHYSTNCSQFFIHNFDFRVNLTWSWPGLGAYGGVAVGVAVAVGMNDEAMLDSHA